MIDIEIRRGDKVEHAVCTDEVIVGSGAGSGLKLSGWTVAREHARLYRTAAGVLVQDLGSLGGVLVNGQRVDSQHGPLSEGDVVTVGRYALRVAGSCPEDRGAEAGLPAGTGGAPAPVVAAPAANDASRPAAPASASASAQASATFAAPEPAPAPATIPAVLAADAPAAQDRALQDDWRKRVHARLLEVIDLRRHDVSSMDDQALRIQTGSIVAAIVRELRQQPVPGLDWDLLSAQVLDEAIGLGPLEELLADESVTEIMVNRFDEIYIERAGRLQRHPLTFSGERAVVGVIERIVAPLGRRIDESSPMVDARLKDGSRVNAIIGPLALKGAALTIRKFPGRRLGADDLVGFGALSADMAAFLRICVEARKNIIVCGGTGSGKTTLLNILSNFIPDYERIITVEDAAELKLHHEHLISLESRPPNVEGKGAVTIRELVKNTLRMRPDRIVVGECRGAEALDMLQAMNTGHEGSLTTLHANTPRDGLARLETLVLMAGMDLPLPAVREQIASAVHVLVQQSRFACGARKITSITELTGMESGKIQLQEIFRFVSQGYGAPDGEGVRTVRGYFEGCNNVPGFYEALRDIGCHLDMNIFKPARRDEDDPERRPWRARSSIDRRAA